LQFRGRIRIFYDNQLMHYPTKNSEHQFLNYITEFEKVYYHTICSSLTFIGVCTTEGSTGSTC
jgi:hypothetical protein